jgi:hypothetical protein
MSRYVCFSFLTSQASGLFFLVCRHLCSLRIEACNSIVPSVFLLDFHPFFFPRGGLLSAAPPALFLAADFCLFLCSRSKIHKPAANVFIFSGPPLLGTPRQAYPGIHSRRQPGIKLLMLPC